MAKLVIEYLYNPQHILMQQNPKVVIDDQNIEILPKSGGFMIWLDVAPGKHTIKFGIAYLLMFIAGKTKTEINILEDEIIHVKFFIKNLVFKPAEFEIIKGNPLDEMYNFEENILMLPRGEIIDNIPPKKDKMIAGLLAIILGVVGGHKWYLGKRLQGILYIITSLTMVGAFITIPLGIIEGFNYLLTSKEKFDDICIF